MTAMSSNGTKRRFVLLDGEREMLPPELGRAGNHRRYARPRWVSGWGGVNVAEDIDVELLDA